MIRDGTEFSSTTAVFSGDLVSIDLISIDLISIDLVSVTNVCTHWVSVISEFSSTKTTSGLTIGTASSLAKIVST